MRTSLILGAAALVLGLAAGASAQETIPAGQPMSDYSMGAGDCGGGKCGRHGCRLHGHGCRHRQYIEGSDRSFNCGCQGSYKFPVPPQYTYFWPGSVYAEQLMTNYHSPWRFPAIKPYTEEALVPVGESVPEDGLRAVSGYEEFAAPKLRAGQLESQSSAMERFFR